MKKYSKIDYRKYEERDFKMSEYFYTLNLSDVRMMLRHNLSMIPSIRGNFRNSKLFKDKNGGYSCIDCISIGITDKYDSQQHVLSSDCVANQHLREGRNLDDPQDIVLFFTDLLKERKEREEC